MSTNGDGNNQSHMTFTNSTQENLKGLSEYSQTLKAQRQWSNSFLNNDTGYLAIQSKNLQDAIDKYEELEKKSANLTDREKKRNLEMLKQLKEMKAVYDDIKQTREVSDKESLVYAKDTAKLLVDAASRLLDLKEKSSDITDEELKRVKELKKELVDITANIDNTVKALKSNGKTLLGSISETTSNLADKLANISNMINLEKIANNSLEQNARSKAAIITETSKLLGFNSNKQFESFKNSLNNTLLSMNGSMGGLFNSQDMKDYMSNLSTYGVTSSKMAEQQFRSSVMATKYLGTTSETMTAMFKYMKRTNNNDVIDNHNKMIVGLLKSQLGVSKEQLDILSQQTYTDAEALSALGLDKAGQERYINESEASKATLESMNSGWGSLLGNMFNEIISMPYGEMVSKYGRIFGNDIQGIYNELMQGNAGNATNRILSNNFARNTLGNMDTASLSESAKALGIDYGTLNMLKYFGNNGNLKTFSDKYTNAINSVNRQTDESVESYISSTSNLTATEKISNWLDTFLNKLPWKSYLTLANLAFGMYITSGAFKFFDFFKSGKASDMFSAIKNTASGMTGLSSGTSAGGKALMSINPLAAGITAATLAITGFNAMGNNYNNSRSTSFNDMLQGNKEKYGDTIGDIQSIVDSTQDANSSFMGKLGYGSSWNKFKNTLGLWFKRASTSNKGELNRQLTKYLLEGGILDKFETTFSWALLLDSVGSLSALEQAGGSYTRSDLAKYLQQNPDKVGNISQYISSMLDKGWNPYMDGGKKLKSYKDFTSKISAIPEYSNLGMGGPSGGHLRNGMGGDSSGWTSMIHSPWYKVTSMWGNRPNPFGGGNSENHGGMDIAAPSGTPIGSAIDGKVYKAGWVSGFGNAVYIVGNNGKKYIYGHMVSTPVVKTGDIVQAGQHIGNVGSTGRSTGPHLHFQVGNDWTKAGSVDPVPYLTTGVLYPGGVVEGVSGYMSTGATDNTDASSIRSVKSKKFIPKSFMNAKDGVGGDGVTRITDSVNGGFSGLISYLESIREEQSTQRKMLEAFSKSGMSESSFNY